jgi:ribosome modulation factor
MNTLSLPLALVNLYKENNMSTIEEAFTEGTVAYHKGGTCPYSSGEKRRAWFDGYEFARKENNK